MATIKEELQVFLNSNISSDEDLNLDNVKSLLSIRQSEQTKLNSQLSTLTESTKSILSTCLEETKLHSSALSQHDASLTQTTTQLTTFIESPSDLVEKATLLEQKLTTIERAKSYVKALLVASQLSSQALDVVKTEPEKAMSPYIQLVKFKKFVQSDPSLSQYLKKCQIRLFEELESVLRKNFMESLDALNWPTQIKPPYGPQLKTKLKQFEKAFRNLLILQQSSEWEEPDIHYGGNILSPISIMLEGLSLRFRFHFETSKPTNRIDKPEWYLIHVKNTIVTHMPFFMTTIQPILESAKAYLPQKTYVKDQFIRGLLLDVTRKLTRSLPQLLAHPNWLSHTIHQVLEFDQSLQEEFAYDGIISNTVLDNKVWFKAWFDAEKGFAQARYDEIMLDGQAFDIYAEDDLVEKSKIKRTKSAVRLINLLENITAAYRLVPNLAQKFKFLVEIQIGLLGQYQRRLSTAIDSFEALSLIRSVPVPGALPDAVTGVMTANETGGTVSALNRLYRWWTSAHCITDVLKDWTEDEFFLDIQFQINQEPDCITTILEDNTEKNILLHKLQQNQGLFSDALTSFAGLNQRTEKIIVKLATKEWATDARKYARKDTWWQATETPTEISDELYQPLQDMRVTWNYLYTILPQPDFLNVYRQTLKEIEDWYWKNVIKSSQFSSSGAVQLQVDLEAGLWKVGQRWVSKPKNYTKKLKEAVQLLTLPFNNNEESSCDVLMKALADTSQSDYVQKQLDTLGIEVLTNSQIRDVLRRRNDMLYSWN